MEADGILSFTADGFSVYGIAAYAVDFHWSVDGESFEYSMTGGSGIGFGELAEALGIVSDDPETPENETVLFADDIESVEFSDPDLLRVGKTEADTTVGALIAEWALQVEYGSGLTEEEILALNEKEIRGGDWALISLKPFASEERLTVSMKNGDRFEILVTDAQLSARVMTADGEDYIITVTFGPEAGIPDGARLEAEEIPEGTEEYDSMYAQSLSALNEASETEVTIRFSRFFDLSILGEDGKEIEPEKPVSVTVQYADAVNADNARPAVVHFAGDGIEVIEAKSRLSGGGEAGMIDVFEYRQGSFSGIGTIIEAATISDGQYFIVHSVNNEQYALDHNGGTVKVRYYNATKQVKAFDGTDEQSLLWTVKNMGSGYYTFMSDNGHYLVLDGNNIIGTNQTYIYADWISNQASMGDGYDLFGTPNYWNRDTWTPLCFTEELRYSAGDSTSSPGRVRLAKYAISQDSGDVPPVGTYTGREVNPEQLDEWIMSLFDDMPVGSDGYHKTAEVYDYENRIYQIDFTVRSNAQGFTSSVDLAFSVDMSNSMLFPSVLNEIGTIEMKQSALESTLDKSKVYFVISDVSSTSTVNAVFYEGGAWKYEDASKYARGQRGSSGPDYVVPETKTKIQGTDTGVYTLYTTDQRYLEYIGTSGSVYGNPYNRLTDLKDSLRIAFNLLDVYGGKVSRDHSRGVERLCTRCSV